MTNMAKQKPVKMGDIFVVEKLEMVPIDKLVPWQRNPRHNDPAVESVARSIKEFGMIVPIVINDKYEVPAGDTRLKACKLLGIKKVPCVNAKHLTPQQQKAFNVADNKLSELATWNEDMLKDILTEIQNATKGTYDYSVLGFQNSEIDLIFKGWNSNAGRINDIVADDSPALARIVVRCDQDDEQPIRELLTEALVKSKFKGTSIA